MTILHALGTPEEAEIYKFRTYFKNAFHSKILGPNSPRRTHVYYHFSPSQMTFHNIRIGRNNGAMHILITVPLSPGSVQEGCTDFLDGVPEVVDMFDVRRVAVVDSAFLVRSDSTLNIDS